MRSVTGRRGSATAGYHPYWRTLLAHSKDAPAGAVDVTDVQPWFEADNGRRQVCKPFIVPGGEPALERALNDHWGKQEIRRFPSTRSVQAVAFGVRAIEGLVTLNSRVRGGQGVGISHDRDFGADVKAFANQWKRKA